MTDSNSTTDPETDPMFEVSARAFAERFGRRTMRSIQNGSDPFIPAQLAAHFAFQHAPELRGEPQHSDLIVRLMQIGTELNREQAGR